MSGQVFGQLAGGRDERFLRACRDRQTARGNCWDVVRAGADGGRGSARTTWALVPPKPNELTPATRRSLSGNGRPLLGISMLRSRQRNLLAGVLQVQIRGDVAVFEDSAVLISPATPAPASRWPMLVFTDPISSGSVAGRSEASALARARTSTGSPTGVPVPCASTYRHHWGGRRLVAMLSISPLPVLLRSVR